MMNFFDRVALVDRFARIVPWKLAERLLSEQRAELEELGPTTPDALERFARLT